MNAFHPAWDTAALDRPRIVTAEATAPAGELAALAAAALAAPDGPAVERLGRSGVVAVRHAGRTFEVHETLDGWTLAPSTVPTPDPADLAAAARLRARRLTRARHEAHR